jgi:RNA polymerase primary sigma factor
MKKIGPFINQDEISHYLKDVRKLEVLTADKEKALAKIMLNNPSEKQKTQIEEALLLGNLRFVISTAKDYQNQGVDLPDLIAEGNHGLIKAIGNFDWSKGYRFISYAVWWIKQSILQCLNEHARTIRLPANIVQEMYREKKQNDGQESEIPLNKKLQNLPFTVNLGKPINDEGDTLLSLIKNEDAKNPEEIGDTQQEFKSELKKIMEILDERERTIIGDYFGLTGTPRTLSDIGEDFNLTKERVRQIKEKALRKLRNESRTLLDYM